MVLGAAAGGIVVGGGGDAGVVIDGWVTGDGGAVMGAGLADPGLAVLAPREPQAVSAAPNASPMTMMMMTDAGLRTRMVVASLRWAATDTERARRRDSCHRAHRRADPDAASAFLFALAIFRSKPCDPFTFAREIANE
jgi:hypothetical protein